MAITAFHRQEERYSGLSLEFTQTEEKIDILSAVEETKSDTSLNPTIFDNNKGVYIEFDDDYDKMAGDFYTKVLDKLNIKKCEDNFIRKIS
jgi:hypothetical protein